MLVSVVICTYNRADGLRATLECLRQQRFGEFEVVVVNGPSTDHTAAVCREFLEAVRLIDNPLANLSVSRNLGISAAAGEIVAFIDDDALPEPAWLEQAVPHFDDPSVAGVGGIVIDHTGMSLQYAYSAANRFGEPRFSETDSFEKFCVPGADVFPYLQGTNALFRRSALAEIGMFDETFDFYLDETDVCVRLIDAGYVLRQLAVAPVHHKYLPSERRSERRVITNWYSIVRNHVYFGYRHALLCATEYDVMRDAQRFATHAVSDASYHEGMGVVPAGHTLATTVAVGKAIVDGAILGRALRSLRLEPIVGDTPVYERFQLTDRPSDPMAVLLVSSGYPPEFAGGIGRFIGDVAPALAARGHEVRVFTRTDAEPRVDLEGGVWVHRLRLAENPGLLPDSPPHVDGFATAVVDELRRIQTWWSPDVAYGSLWDVELLGIARELVEIPVVPMLATPVAEVAQHEGWLDPEHDSHEMYLNLIRLERELILSATIVHGISDAIVATFNTLYPQALLPERLAIAHIGRADDAAPSHHAPSEQPVVLFVGRLEPRKGIDVFLRAAAVLVADRREIRFVVAGDDSRPSPDGKPYAELWESLAGPNSSQLEFVGAASDDELKGWFDASTMVVMPSRYESFGLVVVEAMMHARAVVASDVGGIPELIDNGVTGVLVPVDDAQGLAHAISDLWSDRDRSVAIGMAGRRHFEQHLDIDAAADRLEVVLRRALRPLLRAGIEAQ